jgi:DNA-binding transcriptional MerR regulator
MRRRMADSGPQYDAFNSLQVMALTGVTRKQVIHWDQKGIIKPSVRPATGRGSQRLYSYEDLLLLRTARALRDRGLSLRKILRCVSFIRKHLPDRSGELGRFQLATDGATVGIITDDGTLVDAGGARGELMLIDIARFDRELRQAIEGKSPRRIEKLVVGEFVYQLEIEPGEEPGSYRANVPGLKEPVRARSIEDLREKARRAVLNARP